MFNKDEATFLLQAVDTHVRANGVNSALAAAIVGQKLQTIVNPEPNGQLTNGVDTPAEAEDQPKVDG